MRKVKRPLAGTLACVFLLLCVFSYNIKVSALMRSSVVSQEALSNSVSLETSFDTDGDTLMVSPDGVNFTKTFELEAGNYQFRVVDDGTLYGHPGTIKDTTATISTSGWVLSDSINAKCTLIATGGSYTFTYNAESHKLQILKDGFTTPEEAGDNLRLVVGDKTIIASKGDKVSYDVYLTADKTFEDIQSILSYNEDKLLISKVKSEDAELTDMEAEALVNCPNISDVVYNSDYSGVVAANASNVKGYDFTDEKLFLTLDFTVIGTGETAIEFTVQEMSVLGGEESYFLYSTKCAEGVSFRELVDVSEQTKPSEPTEPATTESTEPSETTVPATTVATEPSETTVPATTKATEPTEVTVPLTTQATEPTETTTSALTEATEPSEASTSAQPTTETTAPVAEFELGDVNRDGKLNIRDATLIQKYIAKMAEFDDEQILLADYKADGKVNTKDATLIQKKIANLA